MPRMGAVPCCSRRKSCWASFMERTASLKAVISPQRILTEPARAYPGRRAGAPPPEHARTGLPTRSTTTAACADAHHVSLSPESVLAKRWQRGYSNQYARRTDIGSPPPRLKWPTQQGTTYPGQKPSSGRPKALAERLRGVREGGRACHLRARNRSSSGTLIHAALGRARVVVGGAGAWERPSWWTRWGRCSGSMRSASSSQRGP
jgi:hypothetical protein